MMGIEFKCLQAHSVPGLFWFRLFGVGLHGKDIRKHHMFFSERMGLTKTVKVGNWVFKFLGREL